MRSLTSIASNRYVQSSKFKHHQKLISQKHLHHCQHQHRDCHYHTSPSDEVLKTTPATSRIPLQSLYPLVPLQLCSTSAVSPPMPRIFWPNSLALHSTSRSRPPATQTVPSTKTCQVTTTSLTAPLHSSIWTLRYISTATALSRSPTPLPHRLARHLANTGLAMAQSHG